MSDKLNHNLFRYVWQTLASVLVVMPAVCLGKSDAGRPNIVYILADDMGVGDVAAYNPGAKLKTPHLDALIAGGMSFSDAHTASSVCTPTRYSLLTGRYSWRSELKERVLDGYSRALIPASRDTVASLLKRNGYRTTMIGKWHLGLNWKLKDGSTVTELKGPQGIEEKIDFSPPFSGGPCDLGFDNWYGINASLDFPPYTWIENNRVVDAPTVKRPFQGGKNVGQPELMMRSGLQAPDFKPEMILKGLTEKTVAYIGQANGDDPFFLYLSLNAPHTPVVPREGFKGKSGCGIYGDFVEEIDWSVGQVIAALKRKGCLEKTLVIFTADNGASKASFPLEREVEYDHHPSGPYKGRKGSLSEGGHRVPFIAHWPKVIAPGSTSASMCNVTDLYATCADLLGVDVAPNAGEDSYSMLPLFRQHPQQYARTHAVHHDFAGRFAFREGKWKLITSKNKKQNKLYDLEADVSETHNLYSENPEVVAQLEETLTSVVNRGRSTPGLKQKNEGPKWWPQLVWMEQP